MKRSVCCLLLGICMLCLPAQQVYAAPPGPAPHEHEYEKPVPPHEKKHEHEKPVPPHEKKHEHEKPVPPHEKKHEHEKPVPPHEKNHEKPVPPQEHEHQVLPHEKDETEKPAVPTATPTPALTITQTSTSTTVSALGSEVVKYALQFVGNPYKYGGTSLTNGADCSGFVQSVYAHFNYSISRTSREQAQNAGYMNVALKESELQPGDLIFYANNNGVVFHVAMYIGNGKIVHAANANAGIIISEYTYMKPYKARRVIA